VKEGDHPLDGWQVCGSAGGIAHLLEDVEEGEASAYEPLEGMEAKARAVGGDE
jgi:hypothetical protein